MNLSLFSTLLSKMIFLLACTKHFSSTNPPDLPSFRSPGLLLISHLWSNSVGVTSLADRNFLLLLGVVHLVAISIPAISWMGISNGFANIPSSPSSSSNGVEKDSLLGGIILCLAEEECMLLLFTRFGAHVIFLKRSMLSKISVASDLELAFSSSISWFIVL